MAAEVANRRTWSGSIIPAQVDLTDDDARRALWLGLGVGPRVDLWSIRPVLTAADPLADAQSTTWTHCTHLMYVRHMRSLRSCCLCCATVAPTSSWLIRRRVFVRPAASASSPPRSTRCVLSLIAFGRKLMLTGSGCALSIGSDCDSSPRSPSTPRRDGPTLPSCSCSQNMLRNVSLLLSHSRVAAEVTEIHLRPAKKSY